jgi:hypothetical protein
VGAYSESLLSRINTPLLERFNVTLFTQLTFKLPRLCHFTRTTEGLRHPGSSDISGRLPYVDPINPLVIHGCLAQAYLCNLCPVDTQIPNRVTLSVQIGDEYCVQGWGWVQAPPIVDGLLRLTCVPSDFELKSLALTQRDQTSRMGQGV